MNLKNNPARERLIEQVLDATTPAEIATAREAMGLWMQEHPNDEGMRDGFEQLYMIEDAAREIERTCSSPSGPRRTTEQKPVKAG